MNLNAAKSAIAAFSEAIQGNVASPQEVLRRTMICNAQPKPCPKLKRDTGVKTGVSRILGNLANKHRLPDEIKGKSCGVCGCSLMLLLPATEENFPKDTPEELASRPSNCWLTTSAK